MPRCDLHMKAAAALLECTRQRPVCQMKAHEELRYEMQSVQQTKGTSVSGEVRRILKLSNLLPKETW